METVGAYEAKTHLPKLLKRVSQGESITITKHGVPLAVLHSPEFQRKAEPKKIISALRNFRNQHRLNGLCLHKIIKEGRR